MNTLSRDECTKLGFTSAIGIAIGCKNLLVFAYGRQVFADFDRLPHRIVHCLEAVRETPLILQRFMWEVGRRLGVPLSQRQVQVFCGAVDPSRAIFRSASLLGTITKMVLFFAPPEGPRVGETWYEYAADFVEGCHAPAAWMTEAMVAPFQIPPPPAAHVALAAVHPPPPAPPGNQGLGQVAPVPQAPPSSPETGAGLRPTGGQVPVKAEAAAASGEEAGQEPGQQPQALVRGAAGGQQDRHGSPSPQRVGGEAAAMVFTSPVAFRLRSRSLREAGTKVERALK